MRLDTAEDGTASFVRGASFDERLGEPLSCPSTFARHSSARALRSRGARVGRRSPY